MCILIIERYESGCLCIPNSISSLQALRMNFRTILLIPLAIQLHICITFLCISVAMVVFPNASTHVGVHLTEDGIASLLLSLLAFLLTVAWKRDNEGCALLFLA
jgi:hypothetical protein